MAQHSSYWSCSKFADWLRGTKKIESGTSQEWADWDHNAQQTHPVRYWLAEEALDHLQDIITWPARIIDSSRYYINNRWITRTHALTAKSNNIKPGSWCDVGNRFLPCLMDELVDFVEIELAWSTCAWDKASREKYKYPWWRNFYRNWRSREAGLAHLDWASELTYDDDMGIPQPTGQAVAAREIKTIYLWWTETYPRRPDVYDASGFAEYIRLKDELNGGVMLGDKTTDELTAMGNETHKRATELEATYEREDEDMMLRLIKIRQALWT